MNQPREKRWKNHYIDLIDQRRDRIFSTATPEERDQTRAKIQSLLSTYDELIVELGSGSGGHLIEHAFRHPRTLFLGVEMRYKRSFRTVQKAEERGISNLYMIQGDARTVVDLLDDGQLKGLYINFPDPWEKKRWQKHRLISPSFLEAIVPKLVQNGFFSHKTDHPEYFERTKEAIANVKSLSLIECTSDLHSTPLGESLVKSEFEKLFLSQGLPVHHLLCRKK